jgi:acetoin utilization deacetylase AcuC-like enzyme
LQDISGYLKFGSRGKRDHLDRYPYVFDPTLDYPSNEGFEDDYPNSSNVINLPLDGGTEKEAYLEALTEVLDKIKKWGTEALIIPFGADTFLDDPDTNRAGTFKLKFDDYTVIGETIRERLGDIPILVTQEGGYNLEAVPEIVCKFLNSLL